MAAFYHDLKINSFLSDMIEEMTGERHLINPFSDLRDINAKLKKGEETCPVYIKSEYMFYEPAIGTYEEHDAAGNKRAVEYDYFHTMPAQYSFWFAFYEETIEKLSEMEDKYCAHFAKGVDVEIENPDQPGHFVTYHLTYTDAPANKSRSILESCPTESGRCFMSQIHIMADRIVVFDKEYHPAEVDLDTFLQSALLGKEAVLCELMVTEGCEDRKEDLLSAIRKTAPMLELDFEELKDLGLINVLGLKEENQVELRAALNMHRQGYTSNRLNLFRQKREGYYAAKYQAAVLEVHKTYNEQKAERFDKVVAEKQQALADKRSARAEGRKAIYEIDPAAYSQTGDPVINAYTDTIAQELRKLLNINVYGGSDFARYYKDAAANSVVLPALRVTPQCDFAEGGYQYTTGNAMGMPSTWYYSSAFNPVVYPLNYGVKLELLAKNASDISLYGQMIANNISTFRQFTLPDTAHAGQYITLGLTTNQMTGMAQGSTFVNGESAFTWSLMTDRVATPYNYIPFADAELAADSQKQYRLLQLIRYYDRQIAGLLAAGETLNTRYLALFDQKIALFADKNEKILRRDLASQIPFEQAPFEAYFKDVLAVYPFFYSRVSAGWTNEQMIGEINQLLSLVNAKKSEAEAKLDVAGISLAQSNRYFAMLEENPLRKLSAIKQIYKFEIADAEEDAKDAAELTELQNSILAALYNEHAAGVNAAREKFAGLVPAYALRPEDFNV